MDRWVHARVGEDEHAELKRLADAEQRSLSQAVRILLAEALAARHEKEPT